MPDGRHDPDHPDRDRGPARPDPDHAAGARPREPLEAAAGLRRRRSTTSRPPRTTRAGPRRPGRERRPGDQRLLPVRRRRRPRQRDRQRGAARHRAGDLSKLLTANAERLQRAAQPRGAAQGPDHELQHHQRRARRRVGQPRRDGAAAGADAGERRRPSLRNTNATFPYLRAFARDIEPGLRELPATIAVSQPWLKQTRRPARPQRARRIANELRLTGPPAGATAARGAGAVQPDRAAQPLRHATC